MSTEPHRYLETAERIGRRLCREAIWSGSRCNWLGWSMEPVEGKWSPAFRSFGPDLYSGTSGVALFLARLHALSPDPVIRKTFGGAVNQTLSRIGKLSGPMHPSFYSGAAGVAYALIEAGQTLKEDQLVEKGLSILTEVREDEPDNQAIDIISGSAGLIPFLIRIAARFERNDLLETAVKHGRHLLHLAVKSNEGSCWDTMGIESQKPLTGHSHGTGGIAWALLELHQATGESEFREAAIDALRYEQTHFSVENGNWPDFRQLNPDQPQPPSYPLAWCHGAPGIGLSRLRIRQLVGDDPVIAGNIDAALNATAGSLQAAALQGQNFSLCHGAGGNAELLILGAKILERPDLMDLARQAGDQGIAAYSDTNSPWPCGVMNAGENPGLMLGLAGIGHFFLRLHDADNVESVLLVGP